MTQSSRFGAHLACAALLVASLGARPAAAQTAAPGYTNLQVLPADISRAELGEIMLANLQGLGLPRRANEGCLHCHAGSMDEPRTTWDYASDEKPAKATARVMMAMVREINGGFLDSLEHRATPEVRVTCATCHAGRINPMPLGELLVTEYEDGGLDALTRTYRSARSRYYEADAYDFRIDTLIGVANRLADMRELDDAAGVLQLNLEFYDDPQAHGGLIQLRMTQALEADGPDAMVARYHALKDEHPSEAFFPLMLDPLGWRLFRGGRPEPGVRVFELNFEEHSDAFVSHESLAWAYHLSADPRGMEIAERWAAEHPEHESGRTLLDDLRRAAQD